ncbi:MAG: hypothetical protein ACI9TO_000478 [Rickettsiales bacterium]|jgi:hypothetical protein
MKHREKIEISELDHEGEHYNALVVDMDKGWKRGGNIGNNPEINSLCSYGFSTCFAFIIISKNSISLSHTSNPFKEEEQNNLQKEIDLHKKSDVNTIVIIGYNKNDYEEFMNELIAKEMNKRTKFSKKNLRATFKDTVNKDVEEVTNKFKAKLIDLEQGTVIVGLSGKVITSISGDEILYKTSFFQEPSAKTLRMKQNQEQEL